MKRSLKSTEMPKDLIPLSFYLSTILHYRRVADRLRLLRRRTLARKLSHAIVREDPYIK